jgi:hypothetical protein
MKIQQARGKQATEIKQFQDLSLEELKKSADVAWERTMKESCSCGAEERIECRCERTRQYEKKTKELRERWFGDCWENAFKNTINQSLRQV